MWRKDKFMNDIEIFKNEEFGEVRVIEINGEPYFVGKDVATILGYAKPLNALAMHVDEDDSLKQGLIDSMGRTQKAIFINESGLYSLILSSKMPNAKKFKHWVTSDILPTIRKHGTYMTNEVIERTLTDPDYLIQLATTLKEERQARQLAEQTIERQKPLVDFANQVSDTTDLIDMKTMAKLLKDKNINIGRNRLFELLRNRKILMSDNQPYQQYVDAGYFKVNEYTFTNRFGQAKTNRQTFVTGKGQLYIAKKVKEYLN
jgi:prophage antirepressor-like protein